MTAYLANENIPVQDFGNLALRTGKSGAIGVILLRLRVKSPDSISQFLLSLLSQKLAWEGHFSVAPGWPVANDRITRLNYFPAVCPGSSALGTAKLLSNWALSTSQIKSVLSWPPEIASRPSGLVAAA